MLDDGRLTDNRGRVANFKNTIIIMTSNMGAEIILENFEDLEFVEPDKQQEILDATKDEVFEMLKENLRPEFLNRIDEQIMFLPLTKEEIRLILRLLFRKVDKMLGRQGIVIKMSPKAEDWLCDLGYDPQFGARPMKRVLQKEIINELSKHVLAGEFAAGDTIYVDAGKDGLEFSKKPFEGAVNIPDPKEEEEKAKKAAEAKAKKTAATANKRKKEVEELKKATKDLEDAVKDIKKDEKE